MDTIRAIVQQVIREGKHGPFVVATSNQIDGSVTFSLEPTVWMEDEWPEEGMVVHLGKLRRKRAGWRAKEGRFWKLSDEQTQQPARSNEMQFLYPKSQQFPFDVVCTAIVRSLEERNWQVPGIKIEFDVYGSGEEKFRLVRKIKGQDFKLYFCRIQGRLSDSHWNDTAAVTEIVIPKKEIHVYEDESGPTLNLYVGNDWEQEREQFMTGFKVNSKLNKEPRTYLQYKGGCDCQATRGASFEAIGFLMAHINRDAAALARMHHTHSGRRPPVLVHTNDLGREYDPEGDEPKMFRTADVIEEFVQYLENVVLKMILSYPIPTEKVDLFIPPTAIPFPESVGQLFCFADEREVERIKAGQADLSSLPPDERYAYMGNGMRLAALNISNDGTVPEMAYEGFIWCGVGEVTPETPIESLEVPGHYRREDRQRFVVRVKPNRANDIYIADHAAYEKRRRELAGSFVLDGRKYFTGEEVADFIRARARTIIPISEYQDDFKQPVVLINRELSFDEVEMVSEHAYHSRHR